MFMQRVRTFPAAGKVAEVRAIAEEVVRYRHASGLRSALTTVVFGDIQCFTNLIWYDDLAAAQAAREKSLADPAFAALAARLAPLVRQPGVSELYETVVPMGGPISPIRFGMNTTNAPAPGRGPAARAALTGYANARNAAGARVRLSASVSGSARFMLSSVFGSMAELEAHRTTASASPELIALFQSPPLFSGPGNAEIFELLLTNPA